MGVGFNANVTNTYTEGYANRHAERSAERTAAAGRTESYGKGATAELSSEGMQLYKDSMNHPQGMMTDFRTEFAGRMPSIYGEKNANGEYSRHYYYAEQTASNMLKVYGDMYDEIVSGHEAGTRATYIEDKSAEGGYRKLTMEEELSELDKAYRNYAKEYDRRHDKSVTDILDAHAKKVSELSSGRAGIAGEYLLKDNADGGTKSVARMSEEDRAALVQQLKADQEKQQSRLAELVSKLMGGQAKAYGIANGDDSIWKTLAKGDFTVDAATKTQAQKDISEDGYWGVKQTSQRLFDFASALAGDDVEKMKKMQAAMQKGFKQAEKAWGGALPGISHQTMSAANRLFDDYYASKGVDGQ